MSLALPVIQGDGDGLRLVKEELGAHHGALQHRLVLGVAHQDVGDGGRAGVHDAGHRHAELLIAHTAHILYRSHQTGVQYGNAHFAPSFLGCRLQT